MTRKILTAAAVALLMGTATAQADEGFTYTTEAPVPSTLWRAVPAAGAYWQARNVTGCTQGIPVRVVGNLTVTAGPDQGRKAGLTPTVGDCRLFIDTDVALTFDVDRAKNLSGYDARRIPLQLGCAVVFHEVGHALGLPHTESGLMRSSGVDVDVIPAECKAWADAQVRPLTAMATTARVALSSPATRSSCRQARKAAKVVLTDYAQILDGRLAVSMHCDRKGRVMIVRARVVGGARPETFKVFVSISGEDFVVRARPVKGEAA